MNKKLINNMKNKKKGFTLVELIIVIAIIAILAAMAIPKFGAVRLDARISNDISAAKNIQSTAAILVANGTLTNDEAAFDPSDNDGFKDRIDGDIVPKAGTATATFLVTVVDGDITVTTSDISDEDVNLAPATDDTAAAYKTALGK